MQLRRATSVATILTITLLAISRRVSNNQFNRNLGATKLFNHCWQAIA